MFYAPTRNQLSLMAQSVLTSLSSQPAKHIRGGRWVSVTVLDAQHF